MSNSVARLFSCPKNPELIIKLREGVYVECGEYVPRRWTLSAPISINFHPFIDDQSLFVLMMVDPDAPKPDFLHWLVINVLISRDGELRWRKEQEFVPYYPPTPPNEETHRYFFLLYQIPKEIIHVDHMKRTNFSATSFFKRLDLKNVQLIASTMYLTSIAKK